MLKAQFMSLFSRLGLSQPVSETAPPHLRFLLVGGGEQRLQLTMHRLLVLLAELLLELCHGSSGEIWKHTDVRSESWATCWRKDKYNLHAVDAHQWLEQREKEQVLGARTLGFYSFFLQGLMESENCRTMQLRINYNTWKSDEPRVISAFKIMVTRPFNLLNANSSFLQ